MSKQSDAKAAQNYNPKPTPKTCANCVNYQFERVLPEWMVRDDLATTHEENKWKVEINGVEKNHRCGIGGFAVKKTATCDLMK